VSRINICLSTQKGAVGNTLYKFGALIKQVAPIKFAGNAKRRICCWEMELRRWVSLKLGSNSMSSVFKFSFAFTISEFANVAKKNFRKFMSYTQIRKLEIFFNKSQNRENSPKEKWLLLPS
jgi:hypothetical protein